MMDATTRFDFLHLVEREQVSGCGAGESQIEF